jgi:AraC-like DNA-binding protein
MVDATRLYEPAAGGADMPDALWHLDSVRTLFAGPLRYNASHQHGAPVFLAGLYEPFGLRVQDGEWLTCRTAVIPAGVRHELDVGGRPIAVLYIEPSYDGADALAPLVGTAREANGALVGSSGGGSSGEIRTLRALFEDRSALSWTGDALTDVLGFARKAARRALDPRVARAVAVMSRFREEPGTVTAAAAAAGLSVSRLRYVCKESVGVPLRRYRAWLRMRAAIGEIVVGRNFTEAAHAAGFYDQAHFGHDFRRTFGAPASVSLSRVRGRPLPPRAVPLTGA